MRILILTFGTRGDVQPYVALGRALVAAGHQADICAPEGFRDIVDGHGVGFQPTNNDLLDLVQGEMSTMRDARDVYRIYSRLAPAQRSSLEDQWAAAERTRPDLIVYHPKPLGGKHIAERLGVPGVLALPLPFYTPTREFPVPFIGGWPFGGPVNKISFQLGRAAGVGYGRMINDFRRRIGLRSVSWLDDPLRNRDGSPVTVLYPFSRHVRPVPADYPPSAHVTGYWFLPSDSSWQPDPTLIDFLESGRPPVYVGFGSMGFGRGAEQRRDATLAALKANRVRGIVATGWGGLTAGDADDDVLVVDQVPHDWLFPRVAAVIHHGGAGTTGIGLAAGRPTLVTPFLGDQPWWGRQVHTIGAGPAPLPQRRFGSEIASRMRELISTPGYAERAAELAKLIKDEDGTGHAVWVIESLV